MNSSHGAVARAAPALRDLAQLKCGRSFTRTTVTVGRFACAQSPACWGQS